MSKNNRIKKKEKIQMKYEKESYMQNQREGNER